MASLLVVVVLLQSILQLGSDLLEEADLLAKVVLQLGPEVPDACTVEVLDLSQCGAGNDVAAFIDASLPFLFLTLLHFGQGTWGRGGGAWVGKGWCF